MLMKAVSSWSLHRTLGSYHSGDAPGSTELAAHNGGLPLLEFPAQLRAHGYDTAQICHFHLPTRDAGYLAELRSAFADAEVTLDAVLVDDGDLTDPTDADAHQSWISRWLEDSAAIGANRARVIAGKQTPTPERLAESGRRLGELADAHPDVRVVTENWFALTPGAAEVNAVLDGADGRIGFLIDLGNWTGPGKYDQLAAVAGRAETCHAKCHFTDGAPDSDDYAKSLQTLRDVNYDGPLALIYDGKSEDEWDCLEREFDITRRVFA
jgi:sugar phosphate isomerase/epimerase